MVSDGASSPASRLPTKRSEAKRTNPNCVPSRPRSPPPPPRRPAALLAAQPCLIQGLRSWNEWQVCQAAVGTAGDICRALEGGVLPYCDAIVLCLLEDLRNPDLNRGVKPNVISCFGDIALAVGGSFDKYVNDTLLIINQAAETDVPDDDEELVEVGHYITLYHLTLYYTSRCMTFT